MPSTSSPNGSRPGGNAPGQGATAPSERSWQVDMTEAAGASAPGVRGLPRAGRRIARSGGPCDPRGRWDRWNLPSGRRPRRGSRPRATTGPVLQGREPARPRADAPVLCLRERRRRDERTDGVPGRRDPEPLRDGPAVRAVPDLPRGRPGEAARVAGVRARARRCCGRARPRRGDPPRTWREPERGPRQAVHQGRRPRSRARRRLPRRRDHRDQASS